MKLLMLKDRPTFPLQLRRPKHVRDKWISGDREIFKVACNGSIFVYRPKSTPTETKNELGRKVLVIDAEPAGPVAEVWDCTNNLCRVFFVKDGQTYEAVRMNGWVPRLSSLAVEATGEFSKEALDAVELACAKLDK